MSPATTKQASSSSSAGKKRKAPEEAVVGDVSAAHGGATTAANVDSAKNGSSATASTSVASKEAAAAAAAPVRSDRGGSSTSNNKTNKKGRSKMTGGSASASASATASSSLSSSAQPSKEQLQALHETIGYKELNLTDIYNRIQNLCRRTPPIPESNFLQLAPNGADEANDNDNDTASSSKLDKAALKEWAAAVQAVLEEFHLLVACVPPATYAWGTDRSGAAEQNLGLLSAEMIKSQEQLMLRVAPRLNDVLAPVVTLVTDRVEVTRTKKTKKNKQQQANAAGDPTSNGTGHDGDDDDDDVEEEDQELRKNHFRTTHEDPDYVDLCHSILARNAPLMRQVVLAHFDKLLRAVCDYMDAQHKDSQHDSRGFVY